MGSLLTSLLVLVLLSAPASAFLGDDESANDAIATAGIQMVNTGQVTADAGRLSLAIGDLDFLGISGLRAGDRITASTTPLDSPCPGDPICGGRGDFEVPDTILGIFDASGTRVCVFDDAFNNEDDEYLSGTGSLCRFLINTAGDYYVGVTGFSPIAFDGNHFEFGDYAVSVTVSPLVECGDGVDNDGDGDVDLADGGCNSGLDPSEAEDCDDGLDNDGDGRIDFDPVTFADPGDQDTLPSGSGDPGCGDPSGSTESPQCQDGLHNDGDGMMDYDAGYFANGTPDPNGPDPQCAGKPWKDKEGKSSGSCGLGAELALVLAPLIWLSSRRRRAAA